MEFQSKQTIPAASPHRRIAWINGQPFQVGSVRSTHTHSPPQEPASTHLHIENPPVEEHSPAARARKAKRRLGRLFEQAGRNAKGQARLCRDDEYEILRCAYRAVRTWRSNGIQEEIECELRAEAAVAISRRSNPFVVLIRCALPRFDIKRASKWAGALEYADAQGIPSKRLSAFLWRVGGVYGAAGARAEANRKNAAGGS
jgi:hypothetical protein